MAQIKLELYPQYVKQEPPIVIIHYEPYSYLTDIVQEDDNYYNSDHWKSRGVH